MVILSGAVLRVRHDDTKKLAAVASDLGEVEIEVPESIGEYCFVVLTVNCRVGSGKQGSYVSKSDGKFIGLLPEGGLKSLLEGRK